MAFATSLTLSGYVTSTDPGTVDYQYFTIDRNDTVSLLTITDAFDPEMFLFRDDAVLNQADFIATDDDSGPGLNAYLSRYLLSGSYIVAIGDYNLTLAEAVAGINRGSRNDPNVPGAYQLQISAANAIVTETGTAAPVPEPATLFLLGSGLFGLIGLKKRKK
jgi:hypothetical protein